MELPTDQELSRWLDRYRIAPADDDLHTKIMIEAMAARHVPTPAPQPWLARSMAMMLLTLGGFWLGMTGVLSADSSTASQTTGNYNLESLILGAQSVHDVTL